MSAVGQADDLAAKVLHIHVRTMTGHLFPGDCHPALVSMEENGQVDLQVRA